MSEVGCIFFYDSINDRFIDRETESFHGSFRTFYGTGGEDDGFNELFIDFGQDSLVFRERFWEEVGRPCPWDSDREGRSCVVEGSGIESISAVIGILVGELGFIPVIKVREGRLRGVRNELRMESKREADKEGGVYRRRVLIESLFGTLKSKLGVHIYAKREDIAQKEAMMRIILWNIYLLASE